MGRLTYHNPDGNWGLSNMDIKKVAKELYGAVCKLKDYEDTGYTPDEIDELADLCMRLEGADDGLAEYAVLEEQGLLRKLPCHVGSDVYYIPSKVNFDLNKLNHHEENNRVYHQKVVKIVFTERGWYLECDKDLEYGTDHILVDKFYEETWFLTQVQAEKTLKKMERGE